MADVSEPERRRAKLVYTLIAVFGLLVAAGIVAFTIVFLRDRPTDACARLLGPTDRIEQLAGTKLEARGGAGGERDCDLYLWRAGGSSATAAVTIRNRPAGQFEAARRELEGSGATKQSIPVLGGEGWLYATPARHVIVLRHGETMTRVELEAGLFDVEHATAFATDIASRL